VTAVALAKFIAHLVNHQVSHEILALQVLTVLLEGTLKLDEVSVGSNPCDRSILVALHL